MDLYRTGKIVVNRSKSAWDLKTAVMQTEKDPQFE